MSNTAISVQDLSKKFTIGHQKSGDLRHAIGDKIRGLFKSDATEKEEFWALKDINFEVKHGEAVGIIGRNGAGKSTLLKILSRITEPTKGRFEINGRVSSLLEVGTGFHMELTGRENIFLNGTILGMRRAEIKAKFDEIVAFSGVEKFIDTPVKHYSSGMKVRLAFSVAAHLEPEILIIDEVLAVGDADFQKRCLGKMEDVAGEGRTVIFVSHNMTAVENLCKSGILLEKGEISLIGETKKIVDNYLAGEINKISKFIDLTNANRKVQPSSLKYTSLEFDKPVCEFGEDIIFKLTIDQIGAIEEFKNIEVAFAINNSKDTTIIHGCNYHNGTQLYMNTKYKFLEIRCENNLRPDQYTITLFLRANGIIQDWLTNVATIEVNDGNPYGFNNTAEIQGLILPQYFFDEIVHA